MTKFYVRHSDDILPVVSELHDKIDAGVMSEVSRGILSYHKGWTTP